jgi:spore coat protein H
VRLSLERSILFAVALAGALWASPTAAQTQEDLFDDTQLHDVHLRINERDWQTLRVNFQDDTYYPADLVWNGITLRNVGVRQRGFGSRTASKPNLRVDMNRYASNQRLVGLMAINLDNVYSDASMMRDPVAMKIFARLGIPAPRQAHARLFVNDVYAGVYVIVEPVDRTFVSRVYGEAEADPESGGYLFEYRWIDEYDFSYMGPSLAAYVGIFRAQTRDTSSLTGLYAPLEELIRAINETPRDRFAAEVGRLLDLPQLARFLGIQNCMAELDGFAGYYGANNFSLYRFRDGRPAVVIPWDADNALYSPDMPLGYRLSTSVLARRMMEVPVLLQTYVAAARECALVLGQPAANDARGWLEREIDRLSGKIAAPVLADRFALYNYQAFVVEVTRLVDFARRRPGYLLCQTADFTATGGFGRNCPVPPSPTPTPGIATIGAEQ